MAPPFAKMPSPSQSRQPFATSAAPAWLFAENRGLLSVVDLNGPIRDEESFEFEPFTSGASVEEGADPASDPHFEAADGANPLDHTGFVFRFLAFFNAEFDGPIYPILSTHLSEGSGPLTVEITSAEEAYAILARPYGRGDFALPDGQAIRIHDGTAITSAESYELSATDAVAPRHLIEFPEDIRGEILIMSTDAGATVTEYANQTIEATL